MTQTSTSTLLGFRQTTLARAWALAMRLHHKDPNVNTYEATRVLARFYSQCLFLCSLLAGTALALLTAVA